MIAWSNVVSFEKIREFTNIRHRQLIYKKMPEYPSAYWGMNGGGYKGTESPYPRI
jgi:hypothetical protein